MKHYILRSEATPYPNGTLLKHKSTGKLAMILKQCMCDKWLHYEVQFDGESTIGAWQHPQIEEHFVILLEGKMSEKADF